MVKFCCSKFFSVKIFSSKRKHFFVNFFAQIFQNIEFSIFVDNQCSDKLLIRNRNFRCSNFEYFRPCNFYNKKCKKWFDFYAKISVSEHLNFRCCTWQKNVIFSWLKSITLIFCVWFFRLNCYIKPRIRLAFCEIFYFWISWRRSTFMSIFSN